MNGVATVVMPPRLQAQAARARLSRGLPARMGSSAPIMNGAPQSSPAGSASRSLGRLPPRAAGTTRLAGTVCAQQRGSSWAAPAAPATSTSTALSGCQQRRWRLPGRQPGPALVRGSALLPLPRQQRRDMRARSAEVEGIRLVGLDVMTFLGATVLIVPVCKKLNVSPVLGYLGVGVLLQQLGVFRDLEDTEALSELGVLFLLFEMGLELSTDKLIALSKYVFGLGVLQVALCIGVFSAFELPVGNGLGTVLLERMAGAPESLVSIRSIDEAVVIGAALAQSSSAFVLSLLSESGQMSTRVGQATLGILLLQDIAVVPFLVLLPLIEQGGADIAGASPTTLVTMLAPTLIKTCAGLGALLLAGRYGLRALFTGVAESRSSETFVALCLLTVTGASLATKSMGFSDTLGAFIAGVLLSETSFRAQVEADIRPFKGLLLGLFFVTTGSSVDLAVLRDQWPVIGLMVLGLVSVKTTIITGLSMAFGLNRGEAIRIGFTLAQSGEFAFVLLSLANQLQILPPALNKLLIIVVVISMAATPALSSLGAYIADRLDAMLGVDSDDKLRSLSEAVDIRQDPVVICGFGPTGQMVANMLQCPLAVPEAGPTGSGIPYVAFDLGTTRVAAAQAAGFNVIYGDGSRPAVVEAAGVEQPRAVVICYSDRERALFTAEAAKREWPEVPVWAFAKDVLHAAELEHAGVQKVVVAANEGGLALGSHLLSSLGVRKANVQNVTLGMTAALSQKMHGLAEQLQQAPGQAEQLSPVLVLNAPEALSVVNIYADTDAPCDVDLELAAATGGSSVPPASSSSSAAAAAASDAAAVAAVPPAVAAAVLVRADGEGSDASSGPMSVGVARTGGSMDRM